MTIGVLSMVGQPYAYKFLWAPLMDRFPLFHGIGRRRSWVLVTQLLVALGLSGMAGLNPVSNPWVLGLFALSVAFFSASQDIAIDAYRADILSTEERGLGASVTNFGYRTAMLISGAVALILAAKLGWRFTYFAMAGIMFVNMSITLRTPKPIEFRESKNTLRQSLIEPFNDLLKKKYIVVLLLFLLTYKICDAFALSLNTVFLIRDVGFSLIDVGTITKVVGLVAALLGSLVGGLLLPYYGLYRSLMIFGLLQMTSILPFALLAIVGHNYLLMSISIFLDYFCSALSSVAIVVFLMTLCNKQYTATQYSLLSAITSLGRIFIGPIAAFVVQHIGWVEFYIWSFLIGLPSLILLRWLKHQDIFSIEKKEGEISEEIQKESY